MLPDIHVHIFRYKEAGKAFTKLFYIKRFRLFCAQRHFEQHFIYMVTVRFIGRENVQPVARQGQTVSHNVVSSTPRHGRYSNAQLGYRH